MIDSLRKKFPNKFSMNALQKPDYINLSFLAD
jgi:hypothetical protein